MQGKNGWRRRIETPIDPDRLNSGLIVQLCTILYSYFFWQLQGMFILFVKVVSSTVEVEAKKEHDVESV